MRGNNILDNLLLQSNVLLRLQERKLQAKEKEMFDTWNKENNSRLLEAGLCVYCLFVCLSDSVLFVCLSDSVLFVCRNTRLLYLFPSNFHNFPTY